LTLEQLAGQQLMIGIEGTRATPEVIDLFKDTHAGGIIIFRPNFESAAQFKKLISDLEETLRRRLIVAVDHEGGRVIRLSEGVTVFPDNLALGFTGNENYASEQGKIEARELRRLGFDVNLSPTLDVLSENFSPNIGIRSYGKDPELVSRLGSARIKAMQENGLSACAKHFPGQGQSSIDAHLGLPVLPTDWDEMHRVHLKPFIAAIEAGADTFMTSHPVYPNLDSSKVPATFSKKIADDLLRTGLGFQGVLFSDDMEMGALRNFGSLEDSCVKALRAGHDMVLICHDVKAVRGVHQAIVEAYKNGELKKAKLETSVQRIDLLKRKRQNRFEMGSIMPEKEGARLAEKIAAESIKISHLNVSVPNLFENNLAVIFPRISELRDNVLIEADCLDEDKFIRELLPKYGIRPKAVQIVSLDASQEEIEKSVELAVENYPVLFFCFDPHLYPGCKKLLDALQESRAKLSVIFLRDPYGRKCLKPGAGSLCAYGFRIPQIKAVLDFLLLNRVHPSSYS